MCNRTTSSLVVMCAVFGSFWGCATDNNHAKEPAGNTIFILSGPEERMIALKDTKIAGCDTVKVRDGRKGRARISYRCPRATPQTFTEFGQVFLLAAGQASKKAEDLSGFRRVSQA